MTEYDPQIIRNHADQLYNQADKAPLLTAYASGLIGLVVGMGMGIGLDIGVGPGVLTGVVLGSLAAGVGFGVGRSQAMRMRVAAQSALCQVAIVESLRKG